MTDLQVDLKDPPGKPMPADFKGWSSAALVMPIADEVYAQAKATASNLLPQQEAIYAIQQALAPPIELQSWQQQWGAMLDSVNTGLPIVNAQGFASLLGMDMPTQNQAIVTDNDRTQLLAAAIVKAIPPELWKPEVLAVLDYRPYLSKIVQEDAKGLPFWDTSVMDAGNIKDVGWEPGADALGINAQKRLKEQQSIFVSLNQSFGNVASNTQLPKAVGLAPLVRATYSSDPNATGNGTSVLDPMFEGFTRPYQVDGKSLSVPIDQPARDIPIEQFSTMADRPAFEQQWRSQHDSPLLPDLANDPTSAPITATPNTEMDYSQLPDEVKKLFGIEDGMNKEPGAARVVHGDAGGGGGGGRMVRGLRLSPREETVPPTSNPNKLELGPTTTPTTAGGNPDAVRNAYRESGASFLDFFNNTDPSRLNTKIFPSFFDGKKKGAGSAGYTGREAIGLLYELDETTMKALEAGLLAAGYYDGSADGPPSPLNGKSQFDASTEYAWRGYLADIFKSGNSDKDVMTAKITEYSTKLANLGFVSTYDPQGRPNYDRQTGALITYDPITGTPTTGLSLDPASIVSAADQQAQSTLKRRLTSAESQYLVDQVKQTSTEYGQMERGANATGGGAAPLKFDASSIIDNWINLVDIGQGKDWNSLKASMITHNEPVVPPVVSPPSVRPPEGSITVPSNNIRPPVGSITVPRTERRQ